MNKIWFTSDTHFCHYNIIQYCNRPWSNAQEMNEGLIANWNSLVSENDDVYHLGDVGIGRSNEIVSCLKRLNGKKYLIVGNHDHKIVKKPEFANEFEWIKNYHELNYSDNGRNQFIIMCHYAFKVWNGSHRGSINLFGHSHGTLKEENMALDVGVDSHNYYPISYDQIKQILGKK